MLSPKKTKYRKQFKGRIHGVAKGGFSLNFGSHGLKSVEPERITARQIEAARRAITRATQNSGEPLPEPMRTSAGFALTGTSGKMRIHTRPVRFMARVMARRAASIWRAVMRSGSNAFRP